jgi:hypothetical protein
MKNSFLIALATVLAAPLCFAQNANDISIPEFRQTLMDSLSVVDAGRAEQFGKLLSTVTDATLEQWYKGVPDGRRFQAAVRELKSRKDASRYLPARPASTALAPATRDLPASRFRIDTEQFSPASGPAITSYTAPDIGLATPVYPSGPNWQNMANAINSMLSPGDQASANCTPNAKAGLIIAVSTFNGIKDAADGVCEIVPDVLVVILGEGTEIPAKEICFGVALALIVVDSTLDGLLSDCETQNSMTGAADNRAAYANTVALYNLKFRLKVEQNLMNTANPIGLFELPTSQGGYLEYARAIVKDTIDKVNSTGVNTTSATNALLAGDVYYNAITPNYKLAYKQYRLAYNTAVQ